ncbi:MAG: sigma 54-interacting transcriptional regulator [Deltaproteobacteria bacterium]|nr:sigma 54-interacting transcriptional regulator [Deltaproteobacteria bacterium]
MSKSSVAFSPHKPLSTIGRARGNDLVLDDAMVEATHANLIRAGQSYTVSATGRTADIFVNGHKVRSAKLQAGDVVLIGAWQLTVSEGAPPEKLEEPAPGLSLDLLERLVELSAELMKDTTPNRLFTALLRGLVDLTRAEKGFVLVFQDGQRHLAAAHNVEDERLDLSRVSDSIVNQVVKDLKPIIVSDAMRDTRFGRAQSVVDLKLSSVMAVPLIYRRDLLGVIYLGNDSITDLFTERDLAMLKIYAAQASLMVHHALLLNQLKLDNRNLRDQLKASSQGEILGNCPPMRALFKVIRRVAPTDLSVLVMGETGTGKELVARELHAQSGRKEQPFVAINCGAVPENLLESELFGHKKGAFTGAIADKIGKIEAANGGTLFLDEIGEMPMNLQVKLLRVLQERVIERVGDLKPRPVEIRVVSATNKDLLEMIKGGDFREDLYYRLAELTMDLPPLRERGEDIELLSTFFLHKYQQTYETKVHGFTNQALQAMKQYYWPGNVRELESRIKKALIMSDRGLLNPDDLGLTEQDKRHIAPLADAQEQFKVDYIRQVLELNNWNKAQTARDLGVDARTIFRYIEKFEG